MITKINEFKKLDKTGKEDIDINNDGKVDKSDFYLLNKRRKIAKSVKDKKKKTNENSGAESNYDKAMDLFDLLNNMTYLMDEGFLDVNLDFANGADFQNINQSLRDNNLGGYDETQSGETKFLSYIEKLKKILNAYSVNESININEQSGEDTFSTSGNRIYNVLSGSSFEKWDKKDFLDHIEGTDDCKTKKEILQDIINFFK